MMGEGGGGGGNGKSETNSCKKGRLKKISCKGEVLKKPFLQSELHCRAYKLYLPEWHRGSNFILLF